MADEGTDDWLSAAAEPEPEPKPTAAKPPVASKKREEPADIAPPTEVLGPKKKMNNHWARPIFLQYEYLYNYYHNYYDDYIMYLDRRLRGFEDEKPRPQTWAERALRTYTRNYYPLSTTYSFKSESRSQRMLRTNMQQSYFTCFDRSLKPICGRSN